MIGGLRSVVRFKKKTKNANYTVQKNNAITRTITKKMKDQPIESSFLKCVVASSCAFLSSDQTPATIAGRLSNCNWVDEVLSSIT